MLTPNPKATFLCPVSGKAVNRGAQNVYNPTAIVRDDKVHLLYRADDHVKHKTWNRTCRIGTGGSCTTPGRLGVRASGLMHMLKNTPLHKELKKTLTADGWRRIAIWLDMNSNNICWTDNDHDAINKQVKDQALAPPIDCDPKNPLRTENDRP